MLKKIKRPKPGYTVCGDCGAEYKIGAPHMMFCPSHTCDECGSSFSEVVMENSDGRRVCDCCRAKQDAD